MVRTVPVVNQKPNKWRTVFLFFKVRRALTEIHVFDTICISSPMLRNSNVQVNCILLIEEQYMCSRLRLKCDDTHAETRFRLSVKRTSPFKSTGASVLSTTTTGSRGVRISCSNAGYTMFRGSVKSTGYPLHSPVSPFTSPPCVTVCRHI